MSEKKVGGDAESVCPSNKVVIASAVDKKDYVVVVAGILSGKEDKTASNPKVVDGMKQPSGGTGNKAKTAAQGVATNAQSTAGKEPIPGAQREEDTTGDKSDQKLKTQGSNSGSNQTKPGSKSTATSADQCTALGKSAETSDKGDEGKVEAQSKTDNGALRKEDKTIDKADSKRRPQSSGSGSSKTKPGSNGTAALEKGTETSDSGDKKKIEAPSRKDNGAKKNTQAKSQKSASGNALENSSESSAVAGRAAQPPSKAVDKKRPGPSQKNGKDKAIPSSDRDNSCINALLSLGRDLTASHGVPILPTTEVQPNKRQKNDESQINGQGDSSYRPPPDFWYWLPPGDLIGDWDVLCGRGGESNNFVGNKKYRKVVNEKKDAYRIIPLKQRKVKTAFVRSIVQHVNNCGGRFVDLDEKSGRCYVVTMEKARKKTSQALRETKELKWLEIEPRERKTNNSKNSVCPFCKKAGHKTKIAKACLRHHEWLDANAIKTSEEGGIANEVTAVAMTVQVAPTSGTKDAGNHGDGADKNGKLFLGETSMNGAKKDYQHTSNAEVTGYVSV